MSISSDFLFGQAEETAEKTKCSHPATDTATARTGNCTREQVYDCGSSTAT